MVSSDNAVVQSTTGIFFALENARRAGTAFAVEKSMMTSPATSQASQLGNTGKSNAGVVGSMPATT